MKEVTGVIDHRILLNFRIDPEVMKRNLPSEFTPKLLNGFAIGGICQVSMSKMREKHLPAILGTSSHNAAHRIAVDTSEGQGVYVTKRDTDSWLNTMAGGRVFPGVYSKANFDVVVEGDSYKVNIEDRDGSAIMSIKARLVEQLPQNSVFKSIEEVSDFFKAGNVGWSSKKAGGYDTIELMAKTWNMKPLLIENCYSAYFSNKAMFPEGSVELDSAMLMSNIPHSWVVREEMCDLCCP